MSFFGESFAKLFDIKALLLCKLNLKVSSLLMVELFEGLDGILVSKDGSIVDLHNEGTADLCMESPGKTRNEIASSG